MEKLIYLILSLKLKGCEIRHNQKNCLKKFQWSQIKNIKITLTKELVFQFKCQK